jgi:dihydrofolate reductase
VRPFKAIAAMSLNRIIGDAGKIPWHLPEDFKWFKRTTLGKTVVMGRKTFESLGRPLPNRLNVVLTRNPQLLLEAGNRPKIYEDAKTGSSAVSLLREAAQEQLMFPTTAPTRLVLWSDLQKLLREDRGGEMWVIGGSTIYEQTLPFCNDLYLTLVKRIVPGDAFFPPFEADFEPVSTILENNDFSVTHYRRLPRMLA